MEPTIEAALRAMLSSFTAVTDLVGDRIRPDIMDIDDDPHAILVKVESEAIHSDLDGRGGLITASVIVDAIAYTRLESRKLEQLIRTNGTDPGTGLQGYAGLVGTFQVDGCTLARRVPYLLERQTDEDRDWYGIASYYEIDYREIT